MLVSRHRTGEAGQQFELAEAAAIARTVGTLYNLPEMVEKAKDVLEAKQKKDHRLKNSDGVFVATDDTPNTPIVEILGKSYADTIAQINKRGEVIDNAS